MHRVASGKIFNALPRRMKMMLQMQSAGSNRRGKLKSANPRYANTHDSQMKDTVLIVCCMVIWVTAE